MRVPVHMGQQRFGGKEWTRGSKLETGREREGRGREREREEEMGREEGGGKGKREGAGRGGRGRTEGEGKGISKAMPGYSGAEYLPA